MGFASILKIKLVQNKVAYLNRYFGDVGLLFFLSHVGTQVKAQGWNKEEDHPVTAGEEELNYVLHPYTDNSAMNKMFDFSKMDNSYSPQEGPSLCRRMPRQEPPS
jgi:hypothetical protein